MRGETELKRNTDPICFFESQLALSNQTIVKGINRYLEIETETEKN